MKEQTYFLVLKLWTDSLVSMREDDHGWKPYCIISEEDSIKLEKENIMIDVKSHGVWGHDELPLYRIQPIETKTFENLLERK